MNGEMQNGRHQSCSVKEEVTPDAQHTEATGVPQGRCAETSSQTSRERLRQVQFLCIAVLTCLKPVR